jgi:hypothetical protein
LLYIVRWSKSGESPQILIQNCVSFISTSKAPEFL